MHCVDIASEHRSVRDGPADPHAALRACRTAGSSLMQAGAPPTTPLALHAGASRHDRQLSPARRSLHWLTSEAARGGGIEERETVRCCCCHTARGRVEKVGSHTDPADAVRRVCPVVDDTVQRHDVVHACVADATHRRFGDGPSKVTGSRSKFEYPNGHGFDE